MDRHDVSFFGQKTALIVSSPSKSDPFVYVRFLRKKPDGSWEKPSQKEGLVIKLNILEIISIRDITTRKRLSWKTFHTFKQNKTPISVEWDNYETMARNQPEAETDYIWFNAGNYSRPIRYPETELLRELFRHIVKEKIEFATTSREGDSSQFEENPSDNHRAFGRDREDKINFSQPRSEYDESPVSPPWDDSWYSGGSSEISNSRGNDSKIEVNSPANPPRSRGPIIDSRQKPKATFQKKSSSNSSRSRDIDDQLSNQINARIIRKSQKAVLLQLNNGQEFWAPRSMITSPYDENSQTTQDFVIASWLLKKNQISA